MWLGAEAEELVAMLATGNMEMLVLAMFVSWLCAMEGVVIQPEVRLRGILSNGVLVPSSEF